MRKHPQPQILEKICRTFLTQLERVGYPTQKPLSLYERIIKASSNEGDVLLDPFAGCATTCVAAERLNRQWVGIGIWDKAHEVVLDRLRKEGLAADGYSGDMLAFGDVHYVVKPPERTDSGNEAVAFLRVQERIKEPECKKMSRAEMYKYLLEQYGSKCQGCDRGFDDPRYLQLDHNTPRADGGLNHISNRVLLCGPCNQAKSHIYTLSGLRRLNKKNGWMAKTYTQHMASRYLILDRIIPGTWVGALFPRKTGLESWHEKRYRRCKNGKHRRIGLLTRMVICVERKLGHELWPNPRDRHAVWMILNGHNQASSSDWMRCCPVEAVVLNNWYRILGFASIVWFVCSIFV